MNSHSVGGPVTFLNKALFTVAALLLAALPSFSQVDSVIAQLSNSAFESFGGSVSGDGRFVVFESTGDIATVNPRNSDHNKEIFLLDYAQRRIFQITNTKSVYYDDKVTSESQTNIRVEITNSRPQISNDGHWIIFGSNATTSRPAAPDSTNPGSFDGNAFTTPTPTPTPTPATTPTPTPTPTGTPTPTPTPGANQLTQDGNMEMWLYHVPAAPPVADLSLGDEQPFTDLSGGSFTRLTNTDPSQLPRAGSTNNGPVIADDNHDASISDDGNAVAFVSNRDLVPAVGNPFPTDDNDEIFTYVQTAGALQQVTKTPRGTVSSPIYNKNPSISGNGLRVAFSSTGDNPVVGMTGGNNPSTSRNEEIFYADLNATGAPILGKQVTTTTPTNVGDVVNILDIGRRLSRDGRFIAFDSTANLVSGGANAAGYACFVYDITGNSFRQVGPRSDADSAATGGDVAHYPGFTDYNGSGVPQTLVLESRENIKSDGTIPTTATDGLNPDASRPAQIYSYQLSQPSATAKFIRLANFPPAGSIIGETQPLPSNTLTRMAFTLAASELGTGNADLASEVYYLIKPTVTNEVTPTNSYFTGASHQTIINPTPTPTVTPQATPTPTPTASPTPVTPPNVLGFSPGMLATLDYTATDTPIVARTGVGDRARSPILPVELSGVTLTINGAACLLKSVNGRHIDFMVPEGLTFATDGSKNYPFVLINNGVVMRAIAVIVPSRPDIFRLDNVNAAGGRTKMFNVTNRVHTQEPFVIRTVKIKGGLFVPSVVRVYVTGVDGVAASNITVRIKDQTLTASNVVEIEPGIWGVDVTLTSALLGYGDSQVVVEVTVGSSKFDSRLDDTTSFTRIL